MQSQASQLRDDNSSHTYRHTGRPVSSTYPPPAGPSQPDSYPRRSTGSAAVTWCPSLIAYPPIRRLGVIHSLCCPARGRPASPRKSHSKSQRGQTSGDTQLRQATAKPGQVPSEPSPATSSDARDVTGGQGVAGSIRPSRLVNRFFRMYLYPTRAIKRAIPSWIGIRGSRCIEQPAMYWRDGSSMPPPGAPIGFRGRLVAAGRPRSGAGSGGRCLGKTALCAAISATEAAQLPADEAGALMAGASQIGTKEVSHSATLTLRADDSHASWGRPNRAMCAERHSTLTRHTAKMTCPVLVGALSARPISGRQQTYGRRADQGWAVVPLGCGRRTDEFRRYRWSAF